MNALLTFEPALPTSVAPRELADRSVKIDYEARSLRTGEQQLLTTDPLAPPELRVWRLAINSLATFVLIVMGGLLMTGVAPMFFGYDPVVVVSGSMEPAIRTSDIVITTASDGLDLGVGTIINFDFEDGTRLHRVAEAAPDGYRTAGDANRIADTALVAPDQVRGIGVVVVPFAGLPALWAEQQKWGHMAAAAAGLVIALYCSRRRWIEPKSELSFS